MWLNKILTIDQLGDRTYFKPINDLDFEYKKAAVLRILTGLILLYRTIQIVDVKLLIEGSNPLFFFNCGIITVIILFILGAFTSVISILLLIVYWEFDRLNNTYTLGSAIFGMFLILQIFTSSGYHYSIDSLLRKKNMKWLKFLSFERLLDEVELKRLYFWVFFLYGLISFIALSYHLVDVYWYYGQTTQIFLTNSYLVSISGYFRDVLANYPRFLFYVSILTILGQSIFQFCMIPLSFNKWGMIFVKYWSLCFFLASLFFIGLSYLPHIELAIWIIFFIRKKTAKASEKVVKKTSFFERKIMKITFLGCIIVTIFFFINNFYFTHKLIKNSKYYKVTANILKPLERVGFIIPLVFNSTDLMMGDSWVVIKKDNKVVSITGENGERLNYNGFDYLFFGNHNSDALYFGNSSIVRRNAIYRKCDLTTFIKSPDIFEFIKKRLIYEYKYNNLKGKVRYQIFCFTNNGSFYKLETKKFDSHLDGQFEVDVEGNKVEIIL